MDPTLNEQALFAAARAVSNSATVWEGFALQDAKTCVTAYLAAQPTLASTSTVDAPVLARLQAATRMRPSDRDHVSCRREDLIALLQSLNPHDEAVARAYERDYEKVIRARDVAIQEHGLVEVSGLSGENTVDTLVSLVLDARATASTAAPPPEAFYDGRSQEPCLMWAYEGYVPAPHDVVLGVIASPSTENLARDTALRAAVGTVLEGFTLPNAVRKVLETAYYAEKNA